MAEGSNSWSHDCEIGHGYDDDHLFDFDNPSDTDEQGSSSRRSPGASRSPLPFGRAGPATPQSAAARSVASPSPAPRLSLSPIAGPSIRRRTRHTTPQSTSYTRTRSHSREQAGYEGPTYTDEELVHSRNISEEAAAIALDAAPGISPGRGATRRDTPGISPRRADQGNRGNVPTLDMASDPVIGQGLIHRRPQGRGGEGSEGQVYNVQGQLQAGHGAQWLEGTRTQGTEHLHGTEVIRFNPKSLLLILKWFLLLAGFCYCAYLIFTYLQNSIDREQVPLFSTDSWIDIITGVSSLQKSIRHENFTDVNNIRASVQQVHSSFRSCRHDIGTLAFMLNASILSGIQDWHFHKNCSPALSPAVQESADAVEAALVDMREAYSAIDQSSKLIQNAIDNDLKTLHDVTNYRKSLKSAFLSSFGCLWEECREDVDSRAQRQSDANQSKNSLLTLNGTIININGSLASEHDRLVHLQASIREIQTLIQTPQQDPQRQSDASKSKNSPLTVNQTIDSTNGSLASEHDKLVRLQASIGEIPPLIQTSSRGSSPDGTTPHASFDCDGMDVDKLGRVFKDLAKKAIGNDYEKYEEFKSHYYPFPSSRA